MNVLIFVTTLLMIITIITYARLETFRTSQGFQILFQNYMVTSERAFINTQAEKKYETTHISKEKSDNGGKTRAFAIKATPRVTVRYLIDKKERELHVAEANQLTILLKKMMILLYSDQSFFQEMEQKRPGFLDEILASIAKAADSLPKEKKIAKAGELSNLDLGDGELNEVFYKMLKGAPAIEKPQPEDKKSVPKLIDPMDKESKADENCDADILAIDALEAEEYKSPKGYVSLLDFITAENIPQIRVYLASPVVLKAIFDDDSIVQDILKMRKELFHQIKVNDTAKDLLGINFKNQYNLKHDPALDEKILDYSVSKTDPKKYE